jgi:hypothetical protein
MVLVTSSAPAMAQRISMTSMASPVVIQSLHSVTIPPILGVAASAVVPGTGGPAACAGTCFASTVTVRANTRWQLQVSLNQSLAHASIEWIEPGAPVSHHLTPGAYLTVASGDEPTMQRAVALAFTVRDDSGNGAPVDAAQVSELVSYRVVPLP